MNEWSKATALLRAYISVMCRKKTAKASSLCDYKYSPLPTAKLLKFDKCCYVKSRIIGEQGSTCEPRQRTWSVSQVSLLVPAPLTKPSPWISPRLENAQKRTQHEQHNDGVLKVNLNFMML